MSDLTTAEEQLFEQWAAAPSGESSAAPGIARLLQALKAVRTERDALRTENERLQKLQVEDLNLLYMADAYLKANPEAANIAYRDAIFWRKNAQAKLDDALAKDPNWQQHLIEWIEAMKPMTEVEKCNT